MSLIYDKNVLPCKLFSKSMINCEQHPIPIVSIIAKIFMFNAIKNIEP